jgi:arsenate reductase (glutaredoxin)
MTAPAARAPIQVFGRDDSQTTRAALRFFKERRMTVTYVNLRTRPMAPGELRRFVERLGAAACADTDGKAWKAAGLGYMRMDDAELAERLLTDQRLLRLPLCRDGKDVSAGMAESTWKQWVGSGVPAASAPGGPGGRTQAGGPGGPGTGVKR